MRCASFSEKREIYKWSDEIGDILGKVSKGNENCTSGTAKWLKPGSRDLFCLLNPSNPISSKFFSFANSIP